MKNFVKSAIGAVPQWIPPFRSFVDRSLTMFVYHDVADHPFPFSRECELAVSPRELEKQIRFIAGTFNVISMDELLSNNIPPRAAMITFDDGLAGTFRAGLPVLQHVGVPSTVFLNMGPVVGEVFWAARAVYLCQHVDGFREFLAEWKGSPSHPDDPYFECTPQAVQEWEARHGTGYLDELPAYMGPFVTAEELDQYDGDALVTFGHHLYNHYNLCHLTQSEVHTELTENARWLQRYRNTRPVFAFPFGRPGRSFTLQHIEWLEQWGQQRFFTGRSMLNKDPRASVLHRITLTNWHDRPERIWFQIARAGVEAGWPASAPEDLVREMAP